VETIDEDCFLEIESRGRVCLGGEYDVTWTGKPSEERLNLMEK